MTRRIALVLAGVLATQVLSATAAEAVVDWQAPKPKDVVGVKTRPMSVKQRPSWTAADREFTAKDVRGAVEFAGEQVIDLAAPSAPSAQAAGKAAGRDKGRRAGKLPVYVQAAPVAGLTASATRAPGAPAKPVGRVKVTFLGRAATRQAGIDGAALTLSRADGVRNAAPTTVTVDYRALGGTFGPDALSRLSFVRLSDGQPIASVNDEKAGTLSATVMVGSASAGFGIAAEDDGGDGDYKATSLTAASSWAVSQQTGSFGYSVPIKVPEAPGGMKPALALSYSSGSVDGRTAGTNTQGSWVGDGWDMWPGFIERSYRSCLDDRDEKEKKDPNNAGVKGGDLCYFDDNATMSLNGSSTKLVKVAKTDTDPADTNVQYRGVADNGSKIEMISDGRANGDDDGTYWRVTAINGMQYFFGRNAGQGGSTADEKTNSVFAVPVYSNHPDDPGYHKEYAKSKHTRAWRWNLDYAVDLSKNTVTYFYGTETGGYAREGDEDKRTGFDRGGYLKRIDYGSRSSDAASVRPSHRVVFDVADRCVGTCFDKDSKPIVGAFPDTPWEQDCAKAPCKTQYSPTFWTQKRLAEVRTQVYTGSGDAYTDVDSYQLDHTYLQAGVNKGAPMWLKNVVHTGEVTTAGGPKVQDPPIVFDPNDDAMPNRVDTPTDGHSSLFRSRIKVVTTESGAQLGVTYERECTAGALPDPWNNTKSCFPQQYGAPGEKPKLNWFHKYRVSRLDTYDNTGGFEHQQTTYDYLDEPAWAYDDNKLVKAAKRTWSEFRGYGHVRVREGIDAGPQTTTEYRYFRGMDGDPQPKDKNDLPPTGTPRNVVVEDSLGTKIEDHESFAGIVREQTSFDGSKGQWISGTLTTPEHLPATAKYGSDEAWATHTKSTRTRMRLSTGATRWTAVENTYDARNFLTHVNDLGDESTPDDDRCTINGYLRNESAGILDRVNHTKVIGVKCGATYANKDVLGEVKTYFDDNKVYGREPTRGLAVRIDELSGWDGSKPIFVPTTQTGYDVHGRPESETDALGRTATTTYVPKTGGPLRQTILTNAAKHVSTTTVDPALGLPVKTQGLNEAVTETTYDGAGRVLGIWAAGRAKKDHPKTPNMAVTYQLRSDAASTVTTRKLTGFNNDTYHTSVTLLDGLLRTRQVQSQTISGGRSITETVHDSRGLLEWSTTPYYDASNAPPSTTLLTLDGRAEVPSSTQNVYDGAGRLTDAIFLVSNTEKWRTRTDYAGEKTSVTPPKGGTATTTITDARGLTIEKRQYKDPKNVGNDTPALFDRVTFGYNEQGLQTSVVDAARNTWSFEYDLRGRKVVDNDPDKGTTRSEYDAAGQLIKTRDSRQRVLAYTYDDLGRKTSKRQNEIDGPKLAEWLYDTAENGKGRPAKSVRYDPPGSANAYVSEVVGYDEGGRSKGTTVTVPASEGALCGNAAGQPCSYTVSQSYRPNGDPYRTKLPAIGGLPQETVETSYDKTGLADGLIGIMDAGNELYAENVYNQLDQVIQRILGQDVNQVYLTTGIDEQTGRLTSLDATPEGKSDVYSLSYSYDAVGNLLGITDKPDGNQPAEAQCYSYDHLNRITEAFTPKSLNCAEAPSVAGLGGPAPYWQSFTFDAANNRKTETIHGTAQAKRTYTYPPSGGAAGSKPHAVTSVVTTGADNKVVKTDNYAYDPSGNTTCRPSGTVGDTCPVAVPAKAGKDHQALTWDDEGHLAKSTDATGDTTYVYDADGGRLLRRDPAGTTLYLQAGTEVRKPKTTAATATRYYNDVGTIVATRTPAGVTWMVSDHHGTASATVSNDGKLTVTRQRTLPYGGSRGASPAQWPGDKGFIGGTKDNTGLTHLGAREYDPGLGRFVSVDPILDLNDPTKWDGYGYAANSPANLSDPTGLDPCRHKAGCNYNGGSGTWCGVPYVASCRINGTGGSTGGGNNGGWTRGGNNNGGWTSSGNNGGGNNGGGSNGGRFPYFGPPVPKYCYVCMYRPPAQANSLRDRAKAAFLTEDMSNGVREVARGSNAKAPGNGVVVLRFYISDEKAAMGYLAGDDRGPSAAVDAHYRMAIAWDTDSGDVSFSVTDSCRAGGNRCEAQDPIRPDGANSWKLAEAKTDHLSVKFSGLNSKMFCCSVEAEASVDLSGGRAKVRLEGDDYPDFEAFRYTESPSAAWLADDDTDGWNAGSMMPFWNDRDVTFIDGVRQ